jgi:hypothetical protein
MASRSDHRHPQLMTVPSVETLTGVGVKSVRGWDPPGFFEQIGRLENDSESAGACAAERV